jgi:putative FmdB family regulatory protein
MPLYEYRCESCEHQFETIQKFSDPHVSVCPKCSGGPVIKLISSPAFTFKGTGFYITDYARKDQGKGDQDKAEKAEKSDKSDKSADSKPPASETKAASTSDATTPAPKSTPKTDG